MAPKSATVIVFGSTGAGKSSVINMLPDSDLSTGTRAEVSDSAVGVTLRSERYTKTLNSTTLNIFDTAGLNEGPSGSVTPRDAVEGLFNLSKTISNGIDLLVFVIRRGSLKAVTTQNYEMFYQIICNSSLPIVLVVTGGDEHTSKDKWWDENRNVFEKKAGLYFDDCACITALPSAPRFEQSRQELVSLIERNLVDGEPWKVPQLDFLGRVLQQSAYIWRKLAGQRPLAKDQKLGAALASYTNSGAMDESQAQKVLSAWKDPATRKKPIPTMINVVLCGQSTRTHQRFAQFTRSQPPHIFNLTKDIRVFDAVFDFPGASTSSSRKMLQILNNLATFKEISLFVLLTDEPGDQSLTTMDKACYDTFVDRITSACVPVVKISPKQDVISESSSAVSEISEAEDPYKFAGSLSLSDDTKTDKVRMLVSRLVCAHQRKYDGSWKMKLDIWSIQRYIKQFLLYLVSFLGFGKLGGEERTAPLRLLGLKHEEAKLVLSKF